MVLSGPYAHYVLQCIRLKLLGCLWNCSAVWTVMNSCDMLLLFTHLFSDAKTGCVVKPWWILDYIVTWPVHEKMLFLMLRTSPGLTFQTAQCSYYSTITATRRSDNTSLGLKWIWGFTKRWICHILTMAVSHGLSACLTALSVWLSVWFMRPNVLTSDKMSSLH
jgi:hypothetical protein